MERHTESDSQRLHQLFFNAFWSLQRLDIASEKATLLAAQKAAALGACHGIYNEFCSMGFRSALLEQAAKKKIDFILAAESKTELDEILKLSCPERGYSGVVIRNRYHIEEEELLLWFTVASDAKLLPEANSRVEYLFCKFFPEEAERIGIKAVGA